jgi:NAD(P)-dependent dehydrogenase (short-subunit alcohol dehydrogenase family)
MNRLPGITALVTDADADIGRAIALALAREGADVRLIHHISDTEQLNRVARDLGRFEVLVTNTAFEWRRELTAGDDVSRLEQAFRTNLEAAFSFSEALAPRMSDGGSIILTAPKRHAHATEPTRALVAAWHGLSTLTASLAERLSSRRIRVNTVVPGESVTLTALAPIYTFLAASAESGLINGITLDAAGSPAQPLPSLK